MNQLYELQDFIFESSPSRQELLDYRNNNCFSKNKVYVYRNHSFELIEKTISAYLDFANLNIEFIYSDYDDSLSFFDLDIDAELVVLWLDLSRYASGSHDFIKQRLSALKDIYNKNILFAYFSGDFTYNDTQVTCYDISKWRSIFKDNYEDHRLERFSGTKMSMPLILSVSKDLGLNYFPSLLAPSLKCIVFDLDNTLYKGVLGEDGIDGIELTPAHHALQKRIFELAEMGFFICVVSKNDQRDVDLLLSSHQDFLVNRQNFTIVLASWQSKSVSISSIAKELNIGVDSILFVDDNIGELASVKQAHPEIKTILAKEDANITLDVLNNFPGLLKRGRAREDSLRNLDSKANQDRRKIIDSYSKEDFIKQLEVQVEFLINPAEEAYRLTELANKTNQFIFNYKRYSIAQIENIINDNDYAIVAVKVKDKLSDSGIVGVVVLKSDRESTAQLEECFVSCRALGRGIDQIIVSGAIATGMQKLGLSSLLANIHEGERNSPAINYYQENLARFKQPALFEYTLPKDLVTIKITELL